jgi:hypothetical protein
VTFSSAALGAALTEQAAPAAVPVALADTTVQAALQFAAGQATAGVLTAQVVTLAEGGLHAMTLTKWKVAAVLLLGTTVLVGGAGAITHGWLRSGTGPIVAATPLPSNEDVPARPAAPIDPALREALKKVDQVFTAKIAGVKHNGAARSEPPIYFGNVTFQDMKALRGAAPAQPTFNFSYRGNKDGRKNLLLDATEVVMVGVSGQDVRFIVPATDANVAAGRQDVDPDLEKALKEVNQVFTAKIANVNRQGVRDLLPPINFGVVTFRDMKAQRGTVPTEATFNYSYSDTDAGRKNMVLGAKDVVMVGVTGKDVRFVVPLRDINLADAVDPKLRQIVQDADLLFTAQIAGSDVRQSPERIDPPRMHVNVSFDKATVLRGALPAVLKYGWIYPDGSPPPFMDPRSRDETVLVGVKNGRVILLVNSTDALLAAAREKK